MNIPVTPTGKRRTSSQDVKQISRKPNDGKKPPYSGDSVPFKGLEKTPYSGDSVPFKGLEKPRLRRTHRYRSSMKYTS